MIFTSLAGTQVVQSQQNFLCSWLRRKALRWWYQKSKPIIASSSLFLRVLVFDQIFSMAREGERTRLVGTVSIDRPAYMHSFGISERYIILVEFPLVINPLKLLLSGKPFIKNYKWEPERGTRFWVISQDDGEIVAISEGEACFAFFHVNAFEQG
jgi:retinal pigment epithelial membrane protein